MAIRSPQVELKGFAGGIEDSLEDIRALKLASEHVPWLSTRVTRLTFGG